MPSKKKIKIQKSTAKQLEALLIYDQDIKDQQTLLAKRMESSLSLQQSSAVSDKAQHGVMSGKNVG